MDTKSTLDNHFKSFVSTDFTTRALCFITFLYITTLNLFYDQHWDEQIKNVKQFYRTKLGQKKEQLLVLLTAFGGSEGVSKEGSILIWVFELF